MDGVTTGLATDSPSRCEGSEGDVGLCASLTRTMVQLALKHRIHRDGKTTTAREILDWKVCDLVLGSSDLLDEAVNQVATVYLRRRQRELGVAIAPARYDEEHRKAKEYIALHNAYGVGPDETTDALLPLRLNRAHSGSTAPSFALHLRRGNALVGASRRVYSPETLVDGSWRTTAGDRLPFSAGPLSAGGVHHFLLPADGWGSVAQADEAGNLASRPAGQLDGWRHEFRAKVFEETPRQLARLQALARRVECLWDLAIQYLLLAERGVSRRIDVWGADWLDHSEVAVRWENVLAGLATPGTPYWRLRKLMDTWCALFYWPVVRVGLLDGTAPEYSGTESASALADLDDWLDFAEALIGRTDVGSEVSTASLASRMDPADLANYVETWMRADPASSLPGRFPWLRIVDDIAEEHSFVHWELQFAQVFNRGGFDLMVGRPPSIRPTSDVGTLAFLGSPAVYRLLSRSRLDVNHALIIQAWRNISEAGIAALVHPTFHDVDVGAESLRNAALEHLRRFVQVHHGCLVPDGEPRETSYGVHIYGAAT